MNIFSGINESSNIDEFNMQTNELCRIIKYR